MTGSRAPTGHAILVADPDTHVRWALARALELEGHRVVAVDDGNAALEVLAAQPVDLIVTDLRLPGFAAEELLEWIGANQPDRYVIVTGVDTSAETHRRLQHAGAMACFPKPLDFVTFCDFVNTCLMPARFSGHVRDVDLLDYFQLLTTTRKSKRVLVRRPDGTGIVVFDEGRIVHAETGRAFGVAALHEITAWEQGTFLDLPFQTPERPTISHSTSFLLMEAARLRDEGKKEGPSEPPGGWRDDADTSQVHGASGQSDTSRAGREDTGEEQQTFSELRARHQSFLDHLTARSDVACGLLTSRAGLTFARSGRVPAGAEALIRGLRHALAKTAPRLGLQDGTAATLYDADRQAIHIQQVGAHILGLWLEKGADLAAITQWVTRHAEDLP